MNSFKSRSAVRGAICTSVIALMTATSAMAQDITTPAASEAEAESSDAIIVTGSRIARPDLKSTIPITSIVGADLIERGSTNVGDTLNELPQLRSSYAQQNPGLGVGVAGLNLLDLRGLGTQRTLVLVNGRRHVAGDVLNNAVSVDTNTIPNDMIERVDIVTGGNSAIYGSDAIAGVVNFVLRRNFDGLQVRGQAGVSTPGNYGANEYVSAMYGKNFGDGRGNILLHAEFAHQNRVFGRQVPFLRSADGLGVVDSDPGDAVNGSDSIFDNIFIRDQRTASINRYGLIPITQPAGAPACGVGVSNGVTAGIPYNCTYIFGTDGSLAAQTGTRFSTGVIGGIAGGNGQTGREDNLLSVLPKQNRYNFNMLAHYEFAAALEAFVEAKFVRIDTQGSNASAASIQGTFTLFDQRERVRLDNPYLNPAARTTIANALLASGCNPSLTTACSGSTSTSGSGYLQVGVGGPLTAAQRAQIADGSYRFVVARNLSDIGIRDERFQRDTFRVVGGLRGKFNDDWRYEVSVNYGRSKETTNTDGYIDKQRFNLSIDAGRNPVTGQIQCRAQFDPAAALARNTSPDNVAKLAADIAACVPYNPFGSTDNSAAGNYFKRPYHVDAWLKQFVVSAFVSGDTSGFFNMPGGPVSFAIGGEYREEDAYYQQDAFGASGNSTAVAFGGFDPPTFTVKEAFAELRIPVLKDTLFFEELTFSGAARVAKYQGGTGTVWAYNGGVDWSPFRDIRFRANYSRAIRAPNPSETFGELIPNFSPGFQDPCSASQIGSGTALRAANCAAALGANLANVSALGSYSLPILSGVNPNLKAETSKSLTIGAVIQPPFIRGLSLSIDYYNIQVDDVIVALTAPQIVNSCYDLPTGNPFCGLFQRFAGPGRGPTFNEQPGEVLGNTLIRAPFNFAKRIRRGIDTQVNYRTNLTDSVKLGINAIYTHNYKISDFQSPTNPNFENRILSELGDPKDEFRVDTDVEVGPFTFGYRVRYIGPMTVGAWENYNSLNGLPPQNLDVSEIIEYPATFYHDLRLEWKIDKAGPLGNDFRLYAGVDNLLNTAPPLGVAGTGGGSGGSGNDRVTRETSGGAIYDVRGRRFYVGFKAKL